MKGISTLADDISTPDNDSAPTRLRRRAAGRPAGPPRANVPDSELGQGGEPGVQDYPDGTFAAVVTGLSVESEATESAGEPEAAEAAGEPDAGEPAGETEPAGEPAGETEPLAPAGETEPREPPEPPGEAAMTESTDTERPVPSDETEAPARRARRRASRPAGAATVADFRFAGADEEEQGEALEADPGHWMAPALVTFQAPLVELEPALDAGVEPEPAATDETDETDETDVTSQGDEEEPGSRRRRRGRRGRGRSRAGDGAESAEATHAAGAQRARGGEASAAGQTLAPGRDAAGSAAVAAEGPAKSGSAAESDGEREAAAVAQTTGSHRRRRRRRRAGSGAPGVEELGPDEPPTVIRVREPRSRDDDQVRGFSGSTRLEAKRQRRREVRDQGRRRAPIVTEAEFLARREAVERVMVVRNAGERTQIAVLEDGMLVEHYVTRATATSYAGNVYLGRVQNVLPSMEAAFVDIGKGRNAVLYAGEVNYDASALDGKPPKIEQALKSGQSVVVQVTKDPIGHKGARLTSQISLPGRYMVYVPGGASAGISRKLPDTERSRLKAILRKITPEDAGVIVRTAAEGASEDELTRDVDRLQGQWAEIQRKAGRATAPALLYAEPDLVVRVVRDIFNEDFTSLVVQGAGEWETINAYVRAVAPDLADRVVPHAGDQDVFAARRVDEQLLKALDRKVWLPSGGSLILDRTEAMTVIDVNTGRYTGKGGNLEETVTRNNLEAAEEVVRQLRLRDIGGIIVIDFVDMVLESNRELVLRRLTECLGRDRTKHQVAEMTSLGLVQMTRKRVGQGLIEAFSETCTVCGGRGLIVSLDSQGSPKSRQLKPLPSGLIPQALQASAGAPGAPSGDGGGSAPDEAAPARADAGVAATAEAPDLDEAAEATATAEAAAADADEGVLAAAGLAGEDAVPARRAPRRRPGRRAVSVAAGSQESAGIDSTPDVGAPGDPPDEAGPASPTS